MKFRYSLMRYAEKFGVARASRKYNKSKSYIYFWKARFDGAIESPACQSHRPHSHPRQHTEQELKLYQYTTIDEYSRYRILGAYTEQSTYSSTGFLRRVVEAFRRKGVTVECVQTDNGFEFTNRFANSTRDSPTLFECAAAERSIRHKLIKPYTPRHNGKVERSHREDQKRFYDTHRFWSRDDFGVQLAAHQSRSNSRPMRPLGWLSPREKLLSFTVQDH